MAKEKATRWYCLKNRALIGDVYALPIRGCPDCNFDTTVKTMIKEGTVAPNFFHRNCSNCTHHTFEGSMGEEEEKRKGNKVGIIEGGVVPFLDQKKPVEKPVLNVPADRFADLDYVD